MRQTITGVNLLIMTSKHSQFKHGYRPAGKYIPIYRAWQGMRQRCYDVNCPQYKNYGGRGIYICKRWDKFENFLEDMGPHPGKGYSLDRKNNDGIYCKRNCRWATANEQQRNTRLVKITPSIARKIRTLGARCVGKGHRGPGLRRKQLAVRFGVSASAINQVCRGERWA